MGLEAMRRKLANRIFDFEGEMEFAHSATHATRQWADEGLGFNCTFVDDDMRVIVGLAQRAVLAGLASDFDPAMRDTFWAVAQKWRDDHERSLGRPIAIQP